MIKIKKLENLIRESLRDSDKFLVDVIYKPGKKLFVFIDSDTSVTVSDCAVVNRYIKTALGSDLDQYDVLVSSHGLDQPLKHRRQFNKYINKGIQFVTNEGNKKTGILLKVNDTEIQIRPEKNSKDEKTVQTENYAFNEIKEVKPIISFSQVTKL